jgi:hypothetical protein
MKLITALVSLLNAVAVSAALVHDSGTEFTSSGDFNADGFPDVVVASRDTGIFRIGFGSAAGPFSWSQPQSSGMASISAMAVGRVLSTTNDSIFFASPEANRITHVTPASPVYNPLSDFFFAGVGPKVVAAIDIPGGNPANTAHLDLITGSVLNPAAQSSLLRSFRSTGSPSMTTLGTVASSDQWIRALGFKPSSAAAELILLQRESPGTESATIYSVASGTPAAISGLAISGLTTGTRFAFGSFDAPQTDIFASVPGSASVVVRRVNAAANGYASTITRTLPSPVSQIHVIHNGLTSQVLVIHSSGSVVIYNYSNAAGFVAASSLNLTNAPGVPSGATITSDGSFQLLFASSASQPSSNLWRFSASGGLWNNLGSDALPKTSAFSGMANVVYLNSPPFITASPQVLRLSSIGDWTDSVILAGAPLSALANWRDDLGASLGLGAASPLSLGSAPASAQSALYNQWRPTISLFWLESKSGAVNEEVTISPGGGSYRESQRITLTSRSEVNSIYFRTSPTAQFTEYSAPFPLYTDTTVETYALSNGAPSAIQKASFTFTNPPHQQDSDNDGVPDFVERALGLNPSSGPDSDGDGFADVEELLADTDSNVASSKPEKHDPSAARFDIHASVSALNGLTNSPAAPADDEAITARDVSSSQLGSAPTASGNGTADLSVQPVDSSLRFLSLATPASFPLVGSAPDSILGREIISLQPIPDGLSISVPFTYNPNSPATQAGAWIAAAKSAYASVQPASANATLDTTASLATILFEWGLTGIARDRGLIDPAKKLCFTKWRPSDESDASLTALSPDDLRSLEAPPSPAEAATTASILVRPAFEALSNALRQPAAASLRTVATEVYRLSSALGSDSPGLYDAPIDALRHFAWNGTLPEAYFEETSLNTADVAAARALATTLISTAFQSRPLVTINVTPSPAPVAGATAVDSVPSGPRYALIDDHGQPFNLPAAFNLPSGSTMTVIGYSDRDAINGLSSIEVVSVLVSSLGAPSPTDSDGNLLPDAWELAFFGAIGQDPSRSGDGSPYSLLQEYLDGTDPGCATDSPASPPVTIGISNVRIAPVPGSSGIRLSFDFPASYANRFKARFLSSENMTQWEDLPEATHSRGTFAHDTTITTPNRFFRAHVSLK